MTNSIKAPKETQSTDCDHLLAIPAIYPSCDSWQKVHCSLCDGYHTHNHL